MMATYLLTYKKTIPLEPRLFRLGVDVGSTTELWHTTINTKSIDEAKGTASILERQLRAQLPKGYDIKLESVEFVI